MSLMTNVTCNFVLLLFANLCLCFCEIYIQVCTTKYLFRKQYNNMQFCSLLILCNVGFVLSLMSAWVTCFLSTANHLVFTFKRMVGEQADLLLHSLLSCSRKNIEGVEVGWCKHNTINVATHSNRGKNRNCVYIENKDGFCSIPVQKCFS